MTKEFQGFIDKQAFKHFKADEIYRHDPPVPLWKNIVPTILVLEGVREKFDIPIYLTSTYRDPAHNKEVNGKIRSLHLLFNATDFVVRQNKFLHEIHDYLCNEKWEIPYEGKIITAEHMGIGIYDTFCHIDTRAIIGRKAPARWDERTKRG